MTNRKEEDNLLFDKCAFSERLTDLRKGDGINSLTLAELSKGIESKTGVYISAAQLGKYENAEKRERININNLLALEKYYDVSLDFLIGRNTTKSDNKTDKHTAKKFGLSDKSMKLLEAINHGNSAFVWEDKIEHVGNKKVSSKLINLILENDDFRNNFDDLLLDYVNAENKSNATHLSKTRDVDIAKYSLEALFRKLIDDIYISLFKLDIKSKPLF